jgi:hypothetical protein
VLGILVSFFPATAMGLGELAVIVLTTAIACVHWLVLRKVN